MPARSQTNAATPATASAAKKQVAKPAWRDLSAPQQQALKPLAVHWDGLTEPHKRKWLAISRNYAKLSLDDQQTLHGRMTEWAALSSQERVQARHNFAAVESVPIDERRAKWEAYQSLSDDEKRKLAARALPRTPGATATIQPTPIQRLAPLPGIASDALHTPRIQLAPAIVTAAPASTPAPAAATPTMQSFPPVSAEAQVPPPPAVPIGGPAWPAASAPQPRATEQPASAP